MLSFDEVMRGGPSTVEWHHGPLPPVESVPYDHLVVLWSPDYIGFVRPWGNNMNPLRWCDNGQFPRWGIDPPSGHWAVLSQGSEVRPPEIQTAAEWWADIDKVAGLDKVRGEGFEPP